LRMEKLRAQVESERYGFHVLEYYQEPPYHHHMARPEISKEKQRQNDEWAERHAMWLDYCVKNRAQIEEDKEKGMVF
jgi:hypothetical protein